MGSVGKLLVRGLGAGMVGYGKTLLQQDERQQKEREADALMRRTAALEDLRTHSQMVTTDFAGRIAERTYRGNKGSDVEAELSVLPAKTAATIAANQAGTAAETAARKEILAIQHQYNLSEIDATQAAAMKRDLETGGATVDRFEVTRDGRGVFFNKKGEVLRSTNPNTFTPPRAEGIGATSVTGYGPGGAGGGTPTTPIVAPDYSQFERILSQAAMHPSNKGKTAAQIRQETIALAREAGIPAPDK